MGSEQHTKQGKKPGNATKVIVTILVVAVIAIGGMLFVRGKTETPQNAVVQNDSTVSKSTEAPGKGITITKSDVTEKAAFIPYQVGETKMEVIAVKASDGTLRTALNTCQVCNNSGRGYYVQEGDELVCQNCGNRFKIDQVEKQKNGCNPVPLTNEYKTETDTTLTVSDEVLQQAVPLFVKWKK